MRPRASRRGAPPGAPSRERWLLSYADFVTLLLALFVVLHALSSVDAARWRETARGVRSAFARPEAARAEPAALAALRTADRATASDTFRMLAERLRRQLATGAAQGAVELRRTGRGVVMALSSEHLFEPGRASLRPEARASLAAVAEALAVTDLPVRVEGHTDDRPLAQGAPFEGNWELSAARAARVVRTLVDEHRLAPRRLAATGFGPWRPVAEGDDDAARARNRRVEIVVLSPELARSGAAAGDGDEALEILLEQLPPLEEPAS